MTRRPADCELRELVAELAARVCSPAASGALLALARLLAKRGHDLQQIAERIERAARKGADRVA